MKDKHAELSAEEYAKRIDYLYENGYRERMLAVLARIASAFANPARYSVSPAYDRSDTEYVLYLVVDGPHFVEPVDISITMAESSSYGDGTAGINFGLDVVAEGGEIIYGINPHNYTPKVWVSLDDEAEIDRRLRLLENAAAEFSAGVQAIERWAAGQRPSPNLE